MLVKKAQKDQVRRSIDNVINETLFPDSQTEIPSKSNRLNINSSLVTYDVALQKENTPSTIQFIQPPQNAYTRHIRASYDIENETPFPVIEHKKKKQSTKHITDLNDTSTTASITNDDSTLASSFSHEDFLKILETNSTQFKADIEGPFNMKFPTNYKQIMIQ